MDSKRAARFAEGTATLEEMTPEERAIEALVRKSARAPSRLEPRDLKPVSETLGARGALEVVSMLGGFHFITRIADMVGIDTELPLVQRRWRWLRTLGVRLQAAMFRRALDLANQPMQAEVDVLLKEMEAVRGAPLPAGYAALRRAPNVALWAHRMTVELPSLDPGMLARVTRAVAEALPSSEEESTGFHRRPSDPLDALAFVGTRYAVRTTDSLVNRVRAAYGWGDGELTDAFFAIAARNAFERVDRLLAAEPG